LINKKFNKIFLSFGPLVFLIIGILAASKRPFHGDEVGSFHFYTMNISEIYSSVLRSDFHPPLSYMVNKYFVNVTSSFESSIYPLIFLSLSLYFFIAVSYEYLNKICSPSIYSFIISLHPSLIVYGFTTRYYSYHISLALVAITLFIKFISVKSNKYLYMLFIVLILCAFTSYISLILSLALAIVLFFERKDLWRKLLALGILYSFLVSPIIFNLFNIVLTNDMGLTFEGINMSTLSYFVGAYELIIGNTIPPSDIVGFTIAFLIFCSILFSLFKIDYQNIDKLFYYLAFIFIFLITISIYTGTITKIRAYMFLSPVLFFLVLFFLSFENGQYTKNIRQSAIVLLVLLNIVGVNNLLKTNSISGWYNYPNKLKNAINSESPFCSKNNHYIFLDHSPNNVYFDTIEYIKDQLDNKCVSLQYSNAKFSELGLNLLESEIVNVKVILPTKNFNKKLEINHFSVDEIKPIVNYNYNNQIRSKIIQIFYEDNLPYGGIKENYRFNFLSLRKNQP
jgi:hypothetical protein